MQHVVATTGHVDHGKSTLVRALTGMEPDRLEEEHRRGLSIELGYVWCSLPTVGDVAFVDVPGHERFVSTMLAGVGPVPAVLFVVAADDPWMPQAAEHLAALDALGVQHGVVAVTRSDLADPAPAAARAEAEVRRTSLREAPVVAVSARTGMGLDRLRAELVAMLCRLPEPDPGADVRLWVDRRFGIKGAGTVVTGTLPAGTVARGDVLASGRRRRVRVRGVQTLGAAADRASGVARTALNVVGDDLAGLGRGSVLVAPDAWHWTEVVDVRTDRAPEDLPEAPILHLGAASLTVHRRPLSADLLRLTLPEPVPLRVGDRALLRDPGTRRVWGVRVLDPAPPALRRRGAAAARASQLAAVTGTPDLGSEVARRGVVDEHTLRRIGVPTAPVPPGVLAVGSWLMSAERAACTAQLVEDAVRAHDRADPLDPGLPLVVLAERAGLPSPALVSAALRPPMRVVHGRVVLAERVSLPADLEAVLTSVEAELAERPFAAPTADRLVGLGLDPRRIAAAAKAGRLVVLAPGVVLLPGAPEVAAGWLADLPQPFTTSQARERLATSRRVVLPLLEHLDRARLTRRLPDDRRVVAGPE